MTVAADFIIGVNVVLKLFNIVGCVGLFFQKILQCYIFAIFHNITMFQNSYQNGSYFEVFDPKLAQDKSKNLYKLQNVAANYKVFDKNLKSFIYEFVSPNAKITLPKEDKKQLYLIQQYLNLQVEFTGDWHIQLAVSDLTKTKRRIILSPAVHKIEKKPFFVKYPCPHPSQGGWINLCIDLYSFIEAFKGSTYRSLDSIQITGSIKLRRIFTTHDPITDVENEIEAHQLALLPKNLHFPPEVEHEKFYVHFQETHQEQLQHTQSTSKSSSHVVSTKNIKREATSKKDVKQTKDPKLKMEKQTSKNIELLPQPKAKQPQNMEKIQKIDKIEGRQILQKQQKVYKDDEKKFLANTNGLECFKSKKNIERADQLTEETSKSIIAPMSTGKNLKKLRQPLAKTQIPKQKPGISIQKNRKADQKDKTVAQDKTKQSQKLNPWRCSTNKKHETGRHESQKIVDPRKIESAQATLFKTRNNLGDTKMKLLESNTDKSRQSDYFQLSQKFSTVNEGRFFKNDQIQREQQHDDHPKQARQEIEQNIEIETSSHYSNSNPNSAIKNKQNIHQHKPIEESINDSLDQFQNSKNGQTVRNKNEKRLSENQSYFNMSSRFGFAEKMMNKFIKQIQRPYSPPLGERDHSEQHEADVREFDTGSKGMELLYDPVLNCYYDHKTHTYYELKN